METLEEVWFAGAHGDIGGGWPRKGKETRTLSTLTLKWMINEMINLPNTTNKVKFGKEKEWAPTMDVEDLAQDDAKSKDDLERYVLVPDEEDAIFPKPHDELVIGRGQGGVSDTIGVIVWRCLGEYAPASSVKCQRMLISETKSTFRSSPASYTSSRQLNGCRRHTLPTEASFVRCQKTPQFTLPSSCFTKRKCWRIGRSHPWPTGSISLSLHLTLNRGIRTSRGTFRSSY